MTIKLLIADGQDVARLGLKSFVAGSEIEVVAEAATGPEAVELAASCDPDCVVMAVGMPGPDQQGPNKQGRDGLSALDEIKQAHPTLPVIVTANQHHPAHLALAHSLGASGYLLKDVGPDDLLAAVRMAVSGGQLWNWKLMRRTSAVLNAPLRAIEADAPLTPREFEVLQGLSCGKTNVEIGREFGISYETVKEHVQHILRKVGVADRTQAAVWAVRQGLV